ncbi:TrkH family potassium uptake protein [Rhodobacteraceae bacterium NNCM2]|nr:TrkH family potassium uptake protein [Coraliihabitans acroporae]
MVLILGTIGLAMLLPASYAGLQQEWRVARAFLHSSIFAFISAAAVAMLMSGRYHPTARRELTVLMMSWMIIPVFAAIPVAIVMPAMGPVGSWFEMVASFTTTGGTAFDDLALVPNAVHLWRGLVAWIGGLVTLAGAYVILAPRKLGGFEIEASSNRGSGDQPARQSVMLGAVTAPLEARLYRALRVILPIYAVLTGVLALIFSALGQGGLRATVHAMSILSTSGISPDAKGLANLGSYVAEIAAFFFMIIAATRFAYSGARQGGTNRAWYMDPELRLMVGLVGVATLMLFSRHWIGALTIDQNNTPLELFDALWGSLFTTLSFLTTTGFESVSWSAAREWSGLANPGLLLLGLCAVGGGAATTAGGIKLIRAYALIKHGTREVERIAHPDYVIGVGADMRGILRHGAVIAWTFIMLYFMALLIAIVGLTTTGMRFETSLIAATAAISNTGPIFTTVTHDHMTFAQLSVPAQVILAFTMIAGRIEVLALIAIFNFDTWRRPSDATIKHW